MKAATGRQKVLIIDDDQLWLEEYRHLLGDEFELAVASDAASAKRVIAADAELDLVILDLVLSPGGSVPSDHPGGLEILEYLREVRRDLSVVVASAFPTQYAEALRDFGVAAVVDKAGVVSDKAAFIAELRKAILGRHAPVKRAAELFQQAIAVELEKYAALKAKTLDIPGQGQYELMRPLVGFKSDLEKRLEKHPFHQNVFLMMRFRPTNELLHQNIVRWLRLHGLRAVRADDDAWAITKNVYNPFAVLYCCKYGIALFDEPEEKHHYSPNVAYELGMMHLQDKSCLILRHTSLVDVPFDLIKDLHKTYTHGHEVEVQISRWVRELGFKASLAKTP